MSTAISRTLSVLLVEDSSADGRLLLEALRPAIATGEVVVQTVKLLALAVEALKGYDFSCVLLDLGLPDGKGVDNVRALRVVDHRPAIVVLTGLDDERVAAQALQLGAQDYLVKGGTDAEQLIKLIRRAVQRNRQTVQLEHLRDSGFIAATRDPFTLLPNLPLLLEHARVLQAECREQRQPFGLGVLVLDGLDGLRDRSGAAFAEQRVREVAEALGENLRPADTLARVAADTFALLPRPMLSAEQLDAMLLKLARCIAALEPASRQAAALGVRVRSGWHASEQQSLEQLLADTVDSAALPKAAALSTGTSAAPVTLDDTAPQGLWQGWIDGNTGRCDGALWQAEPPSAAISVESAVTALAALRQKLIAAAPDDAPPETLALSLAAPSWSMDAAALADALQSGLQTLGIAARSVSICIPQSAFSDVPQAVAAFHRAGFQLLLDCERGVGPSFPDLAQWPLQGIRLHPDYWQRVLDDNLRGPSRRALEALKGAAQALGVRVIACGVDQPETRDALRVIGLRWMQGVAILPALPTDALATRWMQARESVR